MEDVAGHETEAQGALQLGAEQVPPPGRPSGPGAQGTKEVKSKRSREPDSKNEPSRAREPLTPSKRRPINIPHDPTESQLHQSIAELLDWILKPPALYTTFPAGWGKLSKGTAGRLFASGLKKGMPDILVFDRDAKVIGIELKVSHNAVSSAQRTMFAKLQAIGITVYICRTQEDVLAALYREGVSCHSMHIGSRIHVGANAEAPK